MLKKILLVIVVVVAIIFIYAGLQSPNYTVERSVQIHASAEKIFPYLNSTQLAEQWGPWVEIDPQVKMSISGPAEGVGARSSWESAGQMGTGSATIVESIPNQKVAIKLEYTKPMVMTQNSEYLLSSTGSESTVIWRVQGQNNLLGRVMCLFVNMDKMVGGMFEKGLSNLKNLTEKPE